MAAVWQSAIPKNGVASQSGKGNGAGVGAVVTIKNDYRDISHPLGAVGVVFEAKETGGIQVCTEWGVIVQEKKNKKGVLDSP